jgi:hypothetical protein
MNGRWILRRVCGTLVLVIAGCVSITPRVSVPDGPLDGGSLAPRPGPVTGTDGRPAIDQVCRAQARPSGYIAISYTIEGDRCPANSDPANPYNGAVIERHSDRPVGSLMTMCADQGVPSGWTRDHGSRNRPVSCPGARVREDAPTAVVIRRMR